MSPAIPCFLLHIRFPFPGKSGTILVFFLFFLNTFRNCFDFMLLKIYDGFFSETRQILQT